MKIRYELRGEEELLRRLTALSELPGLDLALDRAAETGLKTARAELVRAGEGEVADSLVTETGAGGSRRIVSRHPRAWFAQNGTRRRPASRWLQKSARAASDLFRKSIGEVLARAFGRGGV